MGKLQSIRNKQLVPEIGPCRKNKHLEHNNQCLNIFYYLMDPTCLHAFSKGTFAKNKQAKKQSY